VAQSRKPDLKLKVGATRSLTPAERELQFLQGSALTLIPAMFLVPLFMFLLRAPSLTVGRTIAAIVFSVLAGLILQGLRKLVRAMTLHELDLTTAMAFGVLIVFCVLIGYSTILLFALWHS
jgi:hypothetical protein